VVSPNVDAIIQDHQQQPTFSHFVFFPHRGSQESLVICPTLQHPVFLYTKKTSQCSQTSSTHMQHSSKCPPLLETPFCPQSYPSQSDTEHQCALSLNDKQGSLPIKLHFGCQSLSLYLIVPTPYLNTISATKLLPCLHEWMPCILPL